VKNVVLWGRILVWPQRSTNYQAVSIVSHNMETLLCLKAVVRLWQTVLKIMRLKILDSLTVSMQCVTAGMHLRLKFVSLEMIPVSEQVSECRWMIHAPFFQVTALIAAFQTHMSQEYACLQMEGRDFMEAIHLKVVVLKYIQIK
jgi:hypothetical protein